ISCESGAWFRDLGDLVTRRSNVIVKRFHDATLGDVELRTNGWACFHMIVNGRQVESGIGVITDPDADYRAGLECAKRLATICKSSDEPFRRILADKLLDTYNRDWADEDELTADEFVENL